jgi:poly-gamma-glutamate capsule biosynthesis protein CapA/YwtB (metallophosphatase superfamily)
MLPGTYNLELYRGDTYTWRFILWDDLAMTDPTDLTDAEAEAEIRNKTAGTTIVALTCAVTAPNIIDVTLDADLWATIPTKGVWDLQVTWVDGTVHTVVRGAVTTIGDVVDSVAAPT